MKLKRKISQCIAVIVMSMLALPALATNYVIDTKGAHAFIQFRIKHLGYSWLYGRFNTFSGEFSYDKNSPQRSRVSVTIDTGSLDSNHAERDKHLKGEDFLDVANHPEATFVSTAFDESKDGMIQLTGDLTLHGVTKSITIHAEHIGDGRDPWGGYRRGFEGRTVLNLKDFGIDYDLGPASQQVELTLSVEGIKQ